MGLQDIPSDAVVTWTCTDFARAEGADITFYAHNSVEINIAIWEFKLFDMHIVD